jgi:hypothetical protein
MKWLAPARVAPGDATVSPRIVGLEDRRGYIVRPASGLIVLPDKPYLPPGTLRESWSAERGAVTGATSGGAPCRDSQDIMDRAGGLDAEHDWRSPVARGQRLVGSPAPLAARFAVLERLYAGMTATAAQVLDALVSRGVGCVVLDDERRTRISTPSSRSRRTERGR